MPTYEYGCRGCGEHLEVVQSFHDEPLTVCPSCGGELRKVFGNVGIVFKGSGFYKTDSRAASSKGSTSESKSSTSESKASGSEHSESSATKAESTTSDSKATDKAPQPAGA